MHAKLVRQLEASTGFFSAPATSKLLRAPRRILFNRWASWRSHRAGSTYPVEARLFWGDRMTVVLPDPVSAMIYAYGFYEADLTTFLLHFLEPGSVAFDVGAHFGYYSLLMSKLVGAEGSVHVFEPTPRTFETLQANLEACRNVRLNQAAVWKEDTRLELRDFGASHATFNSVSLARLEGEQAVTVEGNSYEASAIALDDYLDSVGGSVDFLKIDAENAEAEILQGMKRIMAVHRPVCSIEVGDIGVESHGRSRVLLEEAVTRGYVVLEQGVGGALVRHRLREHYGYGNVILVPNERAERVLALFSDSE